MTTKFATILLFSSFLFISKAKAQIIPNGNFENWTLQSNINTADNWQGSALQPCFPTSPIQTTDAVNGNYAILFETTTCGGGLGVIGGNIAVIFPISSNPGYLNGYYKSARTGTGAAEISIRLTNGFTTIGTAQLQINANASTYTPFSIPITYTSTLIADEAGIWLSSDVLSNKVLGNKLWIDSLSFSSSPLAVEDAINTVESIAIYPNPVNDILNIEIKESTKSEIRILNILGQELSKHELHLGVNKINTSLLDTGMYLIETFTNEKKIISKFVKNKN